MTNEASPPALLPSNLTLDQLTMAYMDALLAGKPMHNPIFEGITIVNGRWIRVTYNVAHEWLDELPPEVMAILPAQGNS